jgi:hypothetical protein
MVLIMLIEIFIMVAIVLYIKLKETSFVELKMTILIYLFFDETSSKKFNILVFPLIVQLDFVA